MSHAGDGGNQDRLMASRRIGMFGVEPSESTDDRNEDGVAALLRRRREELERDVDTVARQLRIRAIYIRAIEEGRLQDLPGTAYAVGFVRAYADYLGLDGNSIVSDYRDELARRSRRLPTSRPAAHSLPRLHHAQHEWLPQLLLDFSQGHQRPCEVALVDCPQRRNAFLNLALCL